MSLKGRLSRVVRVFKTRRWTEQLRREAKCAGSLQVNGPGRVISGHLLCIGDNTHFAGDYYIDARGEVEIGENCHLSRNFVLYSANHQYEGEALPYDDELVRKKVVICDNVWIGMNVCIVPGVTIGEGAVVGMGAVVVKDVPPLAVVGGNPAKLLKHRDKERYERLQREGRYGGVSGKLVIKPEKMSLKRRAKRLILRVLPAALRRRLAHGNASAMAAVIEGLPVKGGSEITLLGKPFYAIELEDGTQLIGEESRAGERLRFDWLAAEKGLSDRYVKVLLDVAARYEYPHMAVGYARMKWPLAARQYFHPQHENFAAEDEGFDEETKKELARVFTPQAGWAVIDIGAYFGHGAVRMAKAVGPEGKVLCVEAKEQNVELIREHIRRNDLSHVEVLYNAIWKEAGEAVAFHTTDRQANAIDAEVVDGETVTVMTTSLPALVDELGRVPQLVSLTVNGAEVEAIEGLGGQPAERLPERIMAPGWYTKEGEPRWKLIKPSLEAFGYKVAVTTGGFVFGWRV